MRRHFDPTSDVIVGCVRQSETHQTLQFNPITTMEFSLERLHVRVALDLFVPRWCGRGLR